MKFLTWGEFSPLKLSSYYSGRTDGRWERPRQEMPTSPQVPQRKMGLILEQEMIKGSISSSEQERVTVNEAHGNENGVRGKTSPCQRAVERTQGTGWVSESCSRVAASVRSRRAGGKGAWVSKVLNGIAKLHTMLFGIDKWWGGITGLTGFSRKNQPSWWRGVLRRWYMVRGIGNTYPMKGAEVARKIPPQGLNATIVHTAFCC
jgi:hypothetical protein